jgi:hypothetical protein
MSVIATKEEIWFKNTGFRVKPGMTSKVKALIIHWTTECF